LYDHANELEEFEDTKGAIIIRKSQWPKSTKGQTTIYKTYI